MLINVTIKSLIVASGLALSLLVQPLTAGQLDDAVRVYSNGDYASALKLFEPLAKTGNLPSQYMLGSMYFAGLGTPRNYAEAERWFRQAAEHGHANAQFRLGAMYTGGLGVKQDHEVAVGWYRKAAEQGNALAQFILGVELGDGRGVRRDLVQSHKWLNLAVAGFGERDAKRRDVAISGRNLAESKMTPNQIAEAQRLAQEWLAEHPRP
jgi:TPR repeat protein